MYKHQNNLSGPIVFAVKHAVMAGNDATTFDIALAVADWEMMTIDEAEAFACRAVEGDPDLRHWEG